MNTKLNNNNVWLCLNYIFVTSLLTACGPQSGPEDETSSELTQTQEATSTTTNDNPQGFEPDQSLLDISANASTDLYVEPQFNFDTHKTLNIELQITDVEGSPLGNTMVFLSSISADVHTLDDPNIANKSLLSVLKTDISGNISMSIEVNQTVTNLLVEIDALGLDNEHIIAVGNDGLIYGKL